MSGIDSFAESFNNIFILPQREAFIDEDNGIISKIESEKRLFIFGIVLNLISQMIILGLIGLQLTYFHADANLRPVYQLGESYCLYYLDCKYSKKK